MVAVREASATGEIGHLGAWRQGGKGMERAHSGLKVVGKLLTAIGDVKVARLFQVSCVWKYK